MNPVNKIFEHIPEKDWKKQICQKEKEKSFTWSQETVLSKMLLTELEKLIRVGLCIPRFKCKAICQLRSSKKKMVIVQFVPSFNIASQGETVEKSLEMIKEAIEIFFEDLIENGNLEEVLQDCGWTIELTKNSPIKIIILPKVFNTTINTYSLA